MSLLQNALKEIEGLKGVSILSKPQTSSVVKSVEINSTLEKKVFPLSSEQQSVVSCMSSQLSVVALAGSGKTHTAMKYIAQRSRQSWVYMVFNRSMKEEAQALLPSNSRATTLHAWTYAKFGVPLQHKLIQSLDESAKALILAAAKSSPHPSLRKVYAQLLWQTVERFAQSEDLSPSLSHIPSSLWWALLRNPANTATPLQILDEVCRLWRSCIDVKSPCPASHDHYLKLAQLSGAQWSSPVLLDEAQDASACMLSLVANQKNPWVMMGDPYQTLYSFRGAQGDFADRSQDILSLTGSHRFGSGIADAANLALKHLNSTWLLEGKAPFKSYCVVSENPSIGDVILTYTNEQALEWGVGLLQKGHSVSWLGSLNESWGRLLEMDEWKKGTPPVKDEWKTFVSFKEFSEFLQSNPDHPDGHLIEWLEKMDVLYPTWRVTQGINGTGEQLSDFKIGTIHQSKGMTFDRVFVDSRVMGKSEKSGAEKKDAWQRLYVALTRPRHQLTLPLKLREALDCSVVEPVLLTPCFDEES